MPESKAELSNNLVRKLIELSEGKISPDNLELLIDSLEYETSKFHFDSSAEANLIRIFNSIFDITSFLSDLIKYPHQIEILTAIASSSNYLTDIVVRNPEYLYQVFERKYLTETVTSGNIEFEIKEGIEKFNSFSAQLNFLRQFKKRTTLKIGIADILGILDINQITSSISVVANAINAKLFSLCYDEVLNKYGLKFVSNSYALCSLGKLGGNELNYSSDIDLILFYDHNTNFASIKKEYHELLIEAAELYIKSSTAVTDRGFIYRVDFRLRPDGKFSPLCKSIFDYMRYYESRGEDWERQMLIKLNFICGDRKLYNKFYDFITPYIYPSSFSSSIKEKIRLMKQNIERHNPDKGNIKTFSGGIRDIEFTVQALQLLNGGKNPVLRTGNTIEAIRKLTQFKLLKTDEQDTFINAYSFYRKIEHFLQLMNDTQTHLIPENKDLIRKISLYTNFINEDEFISQLELYRKKVRMIYDAILSNDSEVNKSSIESIQFKDRIKADKNFRFLRTGIGIIDRKEFDSRTIESFLMLEKSLIKYLTKSASPDKVLENLVKVIRSTKFVGIWYSEFRSSKIFNDFLRTCEFSQKAIDLLSTNKLVEEFFLSGNAYQKYPEDEIPNYSSSEIIFLCSFQFGLGLISQQKLSNWLGLFVDSKIKQCNKPDYCKYFIGAMGSYGTSSLSFSSDIDLVVVAETVEGFPLIQSDFQNFLNEIKKLLFPFQVDFRLRPEGNKSPLVIDISNYDSYLSERARLWEFQSLIKLRFVDGDKELYTKLNKLIRKHFNRFESNHISREMLSMYKLIQSQQIKTSGSGVNIKKDRGTLMTIDFIVQSLIFKNKAILKDVIGKSTPSVFNKIKRVTSEADVKTLYAHYKYLKKIEIVIQNLFNLDNTLIPQDTDKRSIISKSLKLNNSQILVDDIARITKHNNLLFDKYVN